VTTAADPPRLSATPLATWERDGVKAALTKAGLPADDVDSATLLFWRFETDDLTPVGFGGLEIHGEHALLRSVVTLPPMRRRGVGRGIVKALEAEAQFAGCRAIWLLTTTTGELFGRLGYEPCERTNVPAAIRQMQQFAVLCPASATVMTKSL
jgi:N-acetylglutamate synthase-like GNAT family acetyltransferase